MSVLPMCTPISRSANIAKGKSHDATGTATIQLGYKLRQSDFNVKRQLAQYRHQPGDIKSATAKYTTETGTIVPPKSTGISIIPVNDERHNNQTVCSEEGKFQKFLKMLEFEKRTDKMITLNKIREFVEQGMVAHEEDINIRREKLRCMLATEEAELMRELVNQQQCTENTRREEIRIRAEQKRIQEEEQRRSLIASKRRQQYLENWPETRERVSRDTARCVKYANLVQMLERENQRHEERKLDELWYRVMTKENEVQRLKEADEQRKRTIAGKETGLILEQQIAGRSSSSGQVQRLREQEKLELERLWDEVRAEELRNLAQEREKRERLKCDLEEQLMSAKRRMLEQARQQAEVERILKVANEEELAKEREAVIKSTECLRNEMSAYMRSLEDLRSEEARREAEVNAIIEASVKDVQARRDLASKRYREERKRILDKFLVEREEQLRLKRQTEESEKKQIEAEKNLLRKDAEVVAAGSNAEAIRRREMALCYGKELQAQRQCDEEKRRREMEKERELHCTALKKNEEYLKLTEELVNAPEIITPSAFKIMLKEYAARRDAQ